MLNPMAISKRWEPLQEPLQVKKCAPHRAGDLLVRDQAVAGLGASDLCRIYQRRY
jgi:hypothetical protein